LAIKVLGISGSPRREGNTEKLLDQALAGAKDQGALVEKLVLNELKFVPCQDCGGCDETGVCIEEDAMEQVYEKVKQADIIILVSPIFFGNLSAQTKMMIDRFQSWWIAKYVLKKPWVAKGRRKGLFLCVGGQNRQDYFEAAEKVVKILFANLNFTFTGSLFYPGIDKLGDIEKHPTALKEAFLAGQELVKDL
jgi:multimeric flavodoxin WrbA